MRTLSISTAVITWAIIQATWTVASPLRRQRVGSGSGGGNLGGLCPERCKCKPNAVYCDGTKIETVPRRLPRNLSTLRLKDNRIRSLQYVSFRRMFDLRHLIITGNRVTYIDPTAFKDLHNLMALSLSGNELDWLSEDTFKHQLLLNELSLSRNRLKSVEHVLTYLENVQVLNLAENQLKRITERTFQGNVAVRILDLHKNNLRHIHRRAFRHLSSLTFLILRDNPLMEVAVHFRTNHLLEQLDITRCQLTSVMKSTPPGLRDLRLSENKIEHVDSDDFQNPSSIQLLVLSYNSIDALSDTALEQMTALYDLHLTQNRLSQLPNSLPSTLHGLYASHNRITRIGERSLASQQMLNSLVLSHNRISEIDPKAMRGLKRLVSLDLSYNNIRVLRTSVFKKLYSLQRLDLSNNPLFQIDPGCFNGLEHLHILKMSSVIGSDNMKTSAFADLHNLLFLDLSNSTSLVRNLIGHNEYALQSIDTVEDLNVMNSGLRGLPDALRVNLPFLRMVKLSGNPWHCDTSLGWLSVWIRSGDVQFFEPQTMVCSSPPKLKGRRLMDLTWNDLAKVRESPVPVITEKTTAPRTSTTTEALTTLPPPPITTAAPIIVKTRKRTRKTTPEATTTLTTTPSTTTASTTTSTTTPSTTTPTTTTTLKTTPSTTTPTTTTPTTTSTTTPTPTSTALTTTPERTTVSLAGQGVFLQFKRVRPSTVTPTWANYPTRSAVYPPLRPPAPPTDGGIPSAEFILFKLPQSSVLRLRDYDYRSDAESSASEDEYENLSNESLLHVVTDNYSHGYDDDQKDNDYSLVKISVNEVNRDNETKVNNNNNNDKDNNNNNL